MSTEQASNESMTTAYPGETLWEAGQEDVRPVLIRQGVVAYRRGNVAIGLLGPGQIALPIPGVLSGGPAMTDLVAITETLVSRIDPATVKPGDLTASSESVVIGADRLGNMSLPQRLAALLLEITEKTGQPIVGCRQDILAMAAAARRETVATILSGWRDEDWIQTRYRRCKVMDRAALIRVREKKE